jgi:hypothetical protein
MRGGRVAGPSRGKAVGVVVAVVILLAGCQGLLGSNEAASPTPSPAGTAPGPTTVTASETPAQPETPTATPTPAITADRLAELERFASRVDADTPVDGKWIFVDGQTVRYRTTPDIGIRDEYGVDADPPPEAIAREMVDSTAIAPARAIVEVETWDGDSLGEFTVTDEAAHDFVRYRLSPREFVNATRKIGNTPRRYVANEAPLLTVNIGDLELRRAYLNRALEWLSENASDSERQIVDSGLYNHSYPIPKQNVKVASNSTVYLDVIAPLEPSETIAEADDMWPALYKNDYYDCKSPDITLQIRVYDLSTRNFAYATIIPSVLAEDYNNKEISKGYYLFSITKSIIEESTVLKNVSNEI